MDNSRGFPDPFYDILDPKTKNWTQKVPKLAQSMVGMGFDLLRPAGAKKHINLKLSVYESFDADRREEILN